jgi:hypothetical protein
MYDAVVAAQAMDRVPPAMERAAMLVEWLRRNVAEFAAQLNKFLGTKARSLDPLWRSSGTRQRHSVLDIPIICAETEEQSVTELYTLPDLPYDPGALEPHISARITELHHDKHHAAYVKGANTALERLHESRATGDFTTISMLEKNLAFNVSGHVLHSVFWTNLSPNGGGEPSGDLADLLDTTFGGFPAFSLWLVPDLQGDPGVASPGVSPAVRRDDAAGAPGGERARDARSLRRAQLDSGECAHFAGCLASWRPATRWRKFQDG